VEFRIGHQGASDNEFQRTLDSALALHGILQGTWSPLKHLSLCKDVFRIFFMRALAKRILLQRSTLDWILDGGTVICDSKETDTAKSDAAFMNRTA
jgi:hypothetical protein